MEYFWSDTFEKATKDEILEFNVYIEEQGLSVDDRYLVPDNLLDTHIEGVEKGTHFKYISL